MIRNLYGFTADGLPVSLYQLTNSRGVEIRITDFGGIVQSIKVPDRQGVMGDIVLGYDDLEGYLWQTAHFGAVTGRVGNRISNARFELEGETYQLCANQGTDHLHGGPGGFHNVLWAATAISSDNGEELLLRYLSPDGEEGYPGNLSVEVDYRLNDDNELVIDYRATTDKATPINLTHHSYFNLGSAEDVLSHELWIDADQFLPVSERLIPTGELRRVDQTAFDFRVPRAIGESIEDDDAQITWAGGGYDHTYVLKPSEDAAEIGEMPSPTLVARVVEPESGRTLEVETTEPGVQFYSGNSLSPEIVGKGGRAHCRHSGFCLETQHFPDSPNRPEFPSVILRPGQEYRSRTVYRFGVDEGG